MRTFEIILLATVTILPFVKRLLVLHISSTYLLIFLGALLSLHLIIEGWRWQMFPAYLLTLILAWRIKVVDISNAVRLSFLRIVGFIGISILALIGWILPMTLPVFILPEPQGMYHVGTETRYVQTNRAEIITKKTDDNRELVYKIWYPSDGKVAGLHRDSYVDPASRMGFATKYGLPAGALNYLDHVKTHVYPGISPAKGTFPVLIFSHGYGSMATGYYALLTELTSQGYIIINMNHTYESLGVTLPNGELKFFDYQFQQEISSGSMAVIEPLMTAFKSKISFEERHSIVSESVRNFYESESMDRWAIDMMETFDLLDSWNKEGTLAGKMDLAKLAVFGHSNGGGSAGKLPLMDERVKAAANLDGITWGNLIDTTYQIPFLYISADWPADHEDINSHVYIGKSNDYFYEAKLLQSGHPNFMDIPFMIPVQKLAGTGTIDPYLGIDIITKLLTSFFDRHLKQSQEANPQDIGEQFELLKMTVYRGDSIK